jgi:regulator of PEP synthase PpsR (kinase-PPPase family)
LALSLETDRDLEVCVTPKLARELAAARRMFADRGWPVIDVTRRSIEETAAAIINLIGEREGAGPA